MNLVVQDAGPGRLAASWSSRPALPSYDQIKALECEIAKLPPAETVESHHFANGIYGRELFIPAGTVLTGKIHKHSTLNVLIEGRITVTTPSGIQTIEAPAVFVSPPGCKKVGYAHTDCRWLNVHPTEETDLAKIESQFIEPEELPARIQQEAVVCLGQQ